MSENTLNLIKDSDAKWVDLRFTDPKGKEQHTTVPAARVDEDAMSDGFMFADRRPVGLLFAGTAVSTLANPIDFVLDRFGVQIDGN